MTIRKYRGQNVGQCRIDNILSNCFSVVRRLHKVLTGERMLEYVQPSAITTKMELLGLNFWPNVDLWPIDGRKLSRDIRDRGSLYRRSFMLRRRNCILLDAGTTQLFSS